MCKDVHKLLICLVLLVLNFNLLHSANQIPYKKLLSNSYKDYIVSHGMQIAVTGRGQKNIDYFNGKEWQSLLPVYQRPDGTFDTINTANNNWSCLSFDPQGRLWTCGMKGLYFYQDNTWHKVSVGDSLDEQRCYTRITFDSSGGIWFTSYYYRNRKKIDDTTYWIGGQISELYYYQNNVFRLVDTCSQVFGGYGMDCGLFTDTKGKVWAHKKENGSQLEYSVFRVFNSPNSTGQFITIKNPHSIVGSGKPATIFITAAAPMPDGSVWLACGENNSDYCDTGILLYQPDGKWKTFTPQQQWLWRSRIEWPDRYMPWDTNYAECVTVLSRSDGSIMAGGYGFWVQINQNGLEKINPSHILNNAVLYCRPWSEDSINSFNYFHLFRDSLDIAIRALLDCKSPTHYGVRSIVHSLCTTSDQSLWVGINTLGILRILPAAASMNMYAMDQPEQMQIYPQPAQHNLHIKLEQAPDIHSEISLYDAAHRLIYRTKAESQNLIIPVDRMIPGYYTLIYSQRNTLFFKKVIIGEL
jgi:hypothetical protein